MRLRFWPLLTLALLFGCKGEEAASTKTPVEFASFDGGYGIDFFQQAAKEYNEKHPDVEVKVWGSNRVWEQLQPRYVSGDVPDMAWNGWGMDEWKLLYEDQLTDLNSALETPGADGTGKWRDAFEEKFMVLGQNDGKQYLMPYHVNLNGWWYNPVLFKKKGWTVPKTYEDLLMLCATIKKDGIAPITFQGQYPYYMWSGFLIPWTISAGGIEAYDAMQQMKPGAWNSPAALRAAERVAELRDKGYFQSGAIGLSHTQSQTEFLNNKVAMIPCGSWLYSEMKEQIPSIKATDPDAGEMEFMLPPVPADAKDSTALGIGIEPFSIPAKAKHPNEAIDYFKYITSKEKAQQFVKEKSTLMAIKGANDIELPPLLQAPAKALADSKVVWMTQYRNWYKDFDTEAQNAFTAFFNKEITAKQFVDRCEAAAEKVRSDPDITKHVYSR